MLPYGPAFDKMLLSNGLAPRTGPRKSRASSEQSSMTPVGHTLRQEFDAKDA